MRRGGVSLVDNYRIVGIYRRTVYNALLMLGCKFFYIKNLSWFTPPSGCLAAKTLYCMAASFLSNFYEYCFTSLHIAAALFWY
jgi:hypothetical protein